MKGARSAQSRPYWIRYVVAFWAVEKLTWAKDNVLIACVCSLAPGLIAAGISAAISDQKWRAATYATLLTYGGLFALFLMWRLFATPWELDRERQRFIDALTHKLAYTKLRIGCYTNLSVSHRRGGFGDSRSSRRHHTFNARSRLASRLRHFS